MKGIPPPPYPPPYPGSPPHLGAKHPRREGPTTPARGARRGYDVGLLLINVGKIRFGSFELMVFGLKCGCGMSKKNTLRLRPCCGPFTLACCCFLMYFFKVLRCNLCWVAGGRMEVTRFTINSDFWSGWCNFSLPKCDIWHACCTHFGIRSRGNLEHKKGDGRIQAWISVDFGWISGPHSRYESCWANFGTKYVLLVMRIYRSHFFHASGVV